MRGAIKLCVLMQLLALTGGRAIAQKLPARQRTGLRAPAHIKIDGKATEWGGNFAAYNKVDDIFYTIANDDDNLYLVVQAVDPDIIEKISKGGITLTIDSDGKKNTKGGIAITFPMYDKKDRPIFLMLGSKPVETKDKVKYKMEMDSFIHVLNQKLHDRLKIIGVTGMKALDDDVVSVYNEEGIKAGGWYR